MEIEDPGSFECVNEHYRAWLGEGNPVNVIDLHQLSIKDEAPSFPHNKALQALVVKKYIQARAQIIDTFSTRLVEVQSLKPTIIMTDYFTYNFNPILCYLSVFSSWNLAFSDFFNAYTVSTIFYVHT